MFRMLAGLLAVCGATCLAQNLDDARATALTTEFQKSAMPVLSARCAGCHSSQLKTGGLNLEQFRNASLAPPQVEIWKKVRDRLTAGTMPPPPATPLSPAESAAVISWIDHVASGPATGAVDPGRVTARRLNRVEYDNTIRDLLGVTIRPAAEFPTDDSGYGFDNIGDVLSLSPLLMEKLMSAARRVSQVAIYGESYPPEPSLLVRIKPKRSQDDSPASGDIFPFSLRGALYGNYHFPVDGQYEFRWRYANLRGPEVTDQPGAGVGGRGGRGAAGTGPGGGRRGPGARAALTPEERKALDERNRLGAPPVQMVFAIDGKPMLNAVVEGNTDYKYSRGETVVRVPVTAGDHYLRASFPELANLDDPRTHVNRDGRRKIFIDYMDIVGPYQPSAAPAQSYRRIFVCGHAPGHHTAQCARRVVENLAHQAYRRPPSERELEPLLKLVALAQKQGDGMEEGVRVSLQAILMSPNFLFRIEHDPVGGAGAYRLNDHELASRLSYFLWSSMPDDELLRAADRGTLRQPGVLEAQVRRMLDDPKSSALAENFAAQWLNLRLLERKKPDAERFPTVDDELLDAMRRETLMFVTALIREDRSILDVIDGRFTFLNGPLARHYGIKGIDGEEFQRVSLQNEERSGIVTQGAILTLSSYATRTSPVLRGKWLLDNLLGTPLPPPPAEVPPLEEANLGTAASVRQRLEQHRANPACGACHDRMDPLGFSLENYDAAGRWRTKDGNFEVDSVGTLPDGKTIAGARGLKDILRSQAGLFTRNFTEKMLTFALGRGLEGTDSAAVDEISRQAAAGDYKFSSLVLGIVESSPFQMRKGTDGGTHESK
jgi:mono/diheme cytochrome c family protein